MTSNFNAPRQPRQEAAKDMDSLQRDQFELLSAYIDGEVTAAERYQVQDWLANDPEMQHLYARLLKLRRGLQKLPVPATEITPQETTDRVFARINRRRIRNGVVWGGAAIAALFVSALSGILPGSQMIPRLAQSPESTEAPEPLMIAVNRPVIEIPKAIESSEKFVQPLMKQSGNSNQHELN
ncbi:MAG TPA: Fis family transcriptional regulator [Cyanobacteria bacterium UBA12227]|nr:Fis family transcriptional regulator [Cyanobacteria bacterium UBA12227]HBY78778.1 Fis family transcriptional regulator [Cyanobacteria bacterium UBA11148]